MRIPLLHLMSGKYQQFGGVPWKQIKGMRDKIAHGYEVIDLDKVWDTALLDIPILKTYCENILTSN